MPHIADESYRASQNTYVISGFHLGINEIFNVLVLYAE